MNYKIPQSVLVVIYTVNLDVLLLDRVDGLGWQSVTGSKDFLDEPEWQVAQREVQEETGLSLDQPGLSKQTLHNWHHQVEFEIFQSLLVRYAPGVTHNLESWFGLQLDDICEIQLAQREHSQYVWLPYEQAAKHCFSPSNAQAVLQLPQRRK